MPARRPAPPPARRGRPAAALPAGRGRSRRCRTSAHCRVAVIDLQDPVRARHFRQATAPAGPRRRGWL